MTSVGIVTPDWPSICDGGIGSLMATLALGLQRRGVTVRVITRGGGRRSRRVRARAGLGPWPGLDVEVVALPGRSWALAGAAHWRRGLDGRLDGLDAVVVARHDELAPVLACFAGPVAVFAHGRDVTASLPPEREAARRVALGSRARWLCLTRWMAGELADRGATAHVVPAAVPAASPVPGTPHTVLSVGRLIARKGHDVLLDALALTEPGVQAVVVGDGPERDRLQRHAERLGLSRRVTFTGFLAAEDLERRWADAALFVLPTRTEADGDTEGFGLVFLEAGARGLPVIGGAAAGVVEAIAPGTGVLLEDPRDPRALAAAMQALLDAPDRRRAMGSAGQRRVEQAHRPEHLGHAVLAALGQAAGVAA